MTIHSSCSFYHLTILRFVLPACPSFSVFCARALSRHYYAGLFWLPPPLFDLSSIKEWLSGCQTPDYVHLDCFAPARPSNAGGSIILNLRQSLAPSSMSKGTFSTGDTRKSVPHADPPQLFLNHRVVFFLVTIDWPLKPINSAG